MHPLFWKGAPGLLFIPSPDFFRFWPATQNKTCVHEPPDLSRPTDTHQGHSYAWAFASYTLNTQKLQSGKRCRRIPTMCIDPLCSFLSGLLRHIEQLMEQHCKDLAHQFGPSYELLVHLFAVKLSSMFNDRGLFWITSIIFSEVVRFWLM